MASTAFRDWLAAELDRQGIKRRELARRLAAKHPQGVTPSTIETYRRAIYRYLDAAKPVIPNELTRRAVAEALGLDPADVPAGDDEEDSLDLAATVQALARDHAEAGRTIARLERILVKSRSAA